MKSLHTCRLETSDAAPASLLLALFSAYTVTIYEIGRGREREFLFGCYEMPDLFRHSEKKRDVRIARDSWHQLTDVIIGAAAPVEQTL